MAVSNWEVANHQIVLKHSWPFGYATLTVDHQRVFKRGIPFFYFPLIRDRGFAHRFELDGIPCAVTVRKYGLCFRYDLLTGDAADSVLESNQMPKIQSELVLKVWPIMIVVLWVIFLLSALFFLFVPLTQFPEPPPDQDDSHF